MRIFILLAAVAAALVFSPPAQAQLQQSFVSLVGNDNNDCTIATPCRTFQKAHDRTTAGGTISCAGSGPGPGADFWGVVISKSITIDCAGVPAVLAYCCAYNQSNAVIVIQGSNIAVKLRNLTIDGGLQAPGSGINFDSGSSLTIENCVIRNYSGIGVIFRPSTPGAQLFIKNSTIENNGYNGQGGGIQVNPKAGGSAGIVLDGVMLGYNVTGMVLSAGNGTIGGVVNNSIVRANFNNGIVTESSSSINLLIDRSSLVNNVGSAIRSSGAASFVRLTDSTIYANQVGGSTASGGTIQSFKNNRIFGNDTDGTPFAAVPGVSGNLQ